MTFKCQEVGLSEGPWSNVEQDLTNPADFTFYM